METAEETLSQSHLKWAKLRIKGNGRHIPASVNIRVGNSLYNCPIWADCRPWVDWFSPSENSMGVCCSPEIRRKMERTEVPMKIPTKFPTGRSQKVSNINGSRPLRRSFNHKSKKEGKVRWMKVSRPTDTHLISNSFSDAMNVCQPAINSFDPLNHLGDSMDVESEKEKELIVPGEDKEAPIIPPSLYAPQKVTLKSRSWSNEAFNDSVSEFSSEFISDNNYEAQTAIIPAHIDEQNFGDNEIIDSLPLASLRPEDWCLPGEPMLLSDCGTDQTKISRWVLSRMKSFKKLLGISSVGFEDKIMELLMSIEEKRGEKQINAKRKLSTYSRKGIRELKNLQSEISYDRKLQHLPSGERCSETALPICF